VLSEKANFRSAGRYHTGEPFTPMKGSSLVVPRKQAALVHRSTSIQASEKTDKQRFLRGGLSNLSGLVKQEDSTGDLPAGRST
jgi:hypothetical protein